MAYFAEKNYFQDEKLMELVQRVMGGDLTLTWWDAKTERVRAEVGDPRRGITYADCNLGSYGWDEIPEFVRDPYSMAARGSEIWGKLPDLGYTVNRKSDVWADNVAELYEESKSRRWVPAIDLDWTALPSPATTPELEAAMAQLCTALEEIALVAMEQARYLFAPQPHRRAQFDDYLERTEHCLFGIAGATELIEPLIVLSGGGTSREQIGVGCRRVGTLMRNVVEAYLGRCDALGL